MSLLEDEPLCEFYLVVFPDGRTRLADRKLDAYDDRLRVIFQAVLDAFRAWMVQYGKEPHATIGDGGPEIARLRARYYAQQEELATLRARVAELEASA